ncbi:BUB3 [Bugula neritina]|uniref:BUB3 n=1 Tax=Bugula neritina TaxID=10212 RepID=A0A7J7JMM6_BUGNE|nr:BUB3 [Bugula neritina]
MGDSSDSSNEYTLKSPPTDCISAVKFQPNSSHLLLVSSWDTGVRLYDVNSNTLRMQYNHPAPVLDCCFHDAVHSYSGGLDNTLKMYDFNAAKEFVVGSHEAGIRCVDYCPEVNVVITGSWDSTVKLWDPRTPCGTGSFSQPDKVYAMAVSGDKLIVGTAKRKVLVWDLRNMGYVQQRRESNLKYQTRCIRAFPNKEAYVLSSIEGRVAVEYLDPSPEVQKKKYAFKCHRLKDDKLEKIYPVNAIAFHQEYNTFATGGSDGYVNIWDPFNKKRLCATLAIASSVVDEDETVGQRNPDQIFIRNLSTAETKPK